MQYIKAIFKFNSIEEFQQDLLISDLADLGFDTFEDSEGGFTAFVIKDNFNEQELKDLLSSYADDFSSTYIIEEVADENWNAEWEKNFSPLIIDDVCYVRATFHEPKPSYPYEVIIDPKMAFGTGHHQTTTMMMQYILSADLLDKNILDMGCGTGILAILAGKLGAKSLMAIDYDDICYESTIENATLNNVINLKALCGSKEVIPDEEYDVIFANINRNILLDQIHRYAEVLKAEGKIFFSGFYLEPDLSMITAECAKYGIKYLDHKQNGDWVAAQFEKK
ncbi:ribosomal protein L11 methyltransferase [Pedobacter psychrotolerans]|uniref:Ribosomal protein L11 methyltransferase n=1 Tax=Pedobacter psychrotolerans TaxID=1843235 RepID=A0A4R2HCY1_9SPHI|nr:50S ribosomal protein L11 methyltransferase [Pedobacter psychrotolerans]TCO25144.1 ribosomal protein L11 methyltransferase [Pedobacter psychrotolerans]GGE47804.1 ribosomal protein L11 methyltransferase [Pedobacter psychrotolerans]